MSTTCLRALTEEPVPQRPTLPGWLRLRLAVAWLACGLAAVPGAPLRAAASAAGSEDLAGTWRFQLDRADAGIGGHWFERKLPEKFKLPGSLPAAGIGDDVTVETKWTGGIVDKSWFTAPEWAKYRQPGNVKIPFWLQPEKYYAGVAWFQREIEIPKDWEGKRVALFLERVHWESRVWVDGTLIGTNNALATPHEYELGIVSGSAAAPAAVRRALATNAAPPGPTTGASSAAPEAGALPIQLAPGKHTVSIRVDNRRVVDIGENSHGITDHTQGNWNGIVGKIELRTTPLVWIEDLQTYPNLAAGSILAKGRLRNSTMETVTVSLSSCVQGESDARIPEPTTSLTQVCGPGDSTFQIEVRCDFRIEPWDEFHPQRFRVTVWNNDGRVLRERRSRVICLREVASSGTQITLNGQKTFIRGTLECAIFPKTGHPPMEVEEWRRIIRVAKNHGLNLLRFHSYCPPEAAFQAADELGMYFQIETCWPNQSTTLGDGKPVDSWVYEETDRILKYYGNHPSFLLMTHGNEPGGDKANAYLAKYVEHFKAKDPRRLWTSGSGWPQLPENQFHVTPDPRVMAWGGGLNSRINARPPETTTDYRDYIAARRVPVISHEIGQWCVYPNFAEIPKYTGYLKPRNFEIFRDLLDQNGMGGLAKQFLLASGKLQTLCYKEDIESALRTPGMGGFELLDLHDFPGQGTALVGVLDPFWEEKGYVTAKEYSRFCNSTVPLARLEKRVFTTDETLEAEIEVAHFRRGTKEQAVTIWKLIGADGNAIASGRLDPHDIPVGNGTKLGKAMVGLSTVKAPARCKLVVGLENWVPDDIPSQEGLVPIRRYVENDWDVWVYPAQPKTEPAKDILVSAQFDDAAQQHLASGGKLLLTLPGKDVRNFDTAPVKLGFSSIFWNTAWTGRQAPTTLGILCDPQHPALAEFPTEFHSDWQWWYLIHRAGALRLDLLPKGTEPIVRVIDDWFTARPLGLVVEGRVGKGKVVVCGFDLTRDADDPVSRQMRASLLAYMASKEFTPKTKFTAEQIQSLGGATRPVALRGVRGIRASSEQEGHGVERVMDGDPATMWHTAWGDLAAGFPHEIVLEFEAPTDVTGLSLTPRQDGLANGWIKDFAVFASNDGRTWGEPVVKGSLEKDAEPKAVRFAKPVRVSWLKLVAYSGHANGPWASLAELGLLAGPGGAK